MGTGGVVGGPGTGGVAGSVMGSGGAGASGSGGVPVPPDGGVDASRVPDATAEIACSVETCNGRDDDCDGVIDDGCPIDQAALTTRTTALTSAVAGSVTEVRNTKFVDACPDGQAVIGFFGNSGTGLDALGVRCGSVKVHEDRSSEPYRYSVAVSPGTEFAPVGGDGGGQNTIDSVLVCGINEVVVATRVTIEAPGGTCTANGCADDTGNTRGCPTVYGLAISCGRYNITGNPGAFKLALAATPTQSARAGSAGRADPAAVVSSFECSSVGLVRQTSGSTGPWPYSCKVTAVNGLQFACADPTVPLR